MKHSAVVTADRVGQNFSQDPELALPIRPRLVPEIQVVAFGSASLLFDGVRGIQVIGGQSARTLLPRILRALDGRRTLDDLATSFPDVSRDGLHNVISLLYSRGLLEDGAPAEAPPDLRDVDSFLGRYVDVTRMNRSRTQALDRLRAARVIVATESAEAATALISQLSGCGLGSLTRYDGQPDSLRRCSLLIAAATRESEDLAPVLDLAQEASVRALHLRIDARTRQIGPLFVPGQSACHACMREIYGRAAQGDAAQEDLDFWLGLAALQAFQLLSRIADPYLYNTFHLYEDSPSGVVGSDYIVARMPGCRRCGIRGPKIDAHSPNGSVWLLHSSTSMPAREFQSPRVHQSHYNASNVALTQELAEPYYGAAATPLPSPGLLSLPLPWRTPAPRSAAMDIDALASVLAYSAGYRELAPGVRWRVAPTGGGLGSPELFVVARAVDGLPEGTYHYDAPRHRLERLRSTSPGLLCAGLGVAETPGADCVLIGTGTLWRLRSKYANFSYRLVNLDAGVSLAYIHDIAAALGLGAVEYPNIHDKGLAEAVSLPVVGNRHVPTFAIGLGEKVPQRDDRLKLLGPPILDAVIEWASKPQAARPREMAAPWEYSLPSPELDDFGELLRARRSTRTFADEPLAAPTLRSLVSLARGMVETRLRAGAATRGVRPWLALNVAAEGFEPGVYTLDAGRPDELRLVRDGCGRDETVLCLLQKSLGSAPALLFVTGDLRAALEERGPRGYRDLLLHAGATVARTLLAATSYGLAACPSGGIMEEGFRGLAGTDGYHECPLFAAALGHAPSH